MIFFLLVVLILAKVFCLYQFWQLYRHKEFISEIQTKFLWCDVKRILFPNERETIVLPQTLRWNYQSLHVSRYIYHNFP